MAGQNHTLPAALVVAVISPDRAVQEGIASALEHVLDVGPLWTVSEYPPLGQMDQIGHASACVIFLDFSDPIRARSVAADIDNNYPMATTIAMYPVRHSQDLIECMQLGIREVITLPVSAADVVRALNNARRILKRESTSGESGGRIFAFLSAKPGTGGTTIAAHSSAAVARLSRQRTLLIDLDLQLGMISFLFKLNADHSIIDALRLSEQLDGLWDRLISRRGMLEVLASASVDFEHHTPAASLAGVLSFARQQYQSVCVDLPGEMREHELDTLKRANEIFLVCSPDIGTLHQAKRKADMLAQLGLRSRVSVIVNRAQGRAALSIADIETVLNLPVRFSLPAADKEIAEATQKAVPIQGHSAFAIQIEHIARRMMPHKEQTAREIKSRRFIELFSITSVRDKVRT